MLLGEWITQELIFWSMGWGRAYEEEGKKVLSWEQKLSTQREWARERDLKKSKDARGRTSKCRRQVAREMIAQVGGGTEVTRVGRAWGWGRTGRTVTQAQGRSVQNSETRKGKIYLISSGKKGGRHWSGINKEWAWIRGQTRSRKETIKVILIPGCWMSICECRKKRVLMEQGRPDV